MRWLVLLLPILTACASSPEADWHGDARFSSDERAAIESGEAWLASQVGRAPATFDWTYEVTSKQALPHTIRRERGPAGDTTTTGMCMFDTHTVYLDPSDPNSTPGTLDGLAAHEMGHCELGLRDDPSSDGIMHFVSPKRWTSREAAQLLR